jgi:8-oxo-dGTP pyrophosphatase MutT (NUDIX family)
MSSTSVPSTEAGHLSHAGGVVFRQAGNGVRVLLVRARPEPHDWVIPKGHIEPGETPEDCARREIREEAGVDCEPVTFLGFDEFVTPGGEPVNAAFFLLRYLDDVKPAEDRARIWLPLSEASGLLSFDGARRIISAASAQLDYMARREGTG